jgi:excisionase family DNA binding protein
MTLDDTIRQLVREEVEAALRGRAPDRPAGEWLTTDQAAAESGVQPKTVRAWVAAGLPATRRGRRLVVSRAALSAWRQGQSPATGLVSTLTGSGG